MTSLHARHALLALVLLNGACGRGDRPGEAAASVGAIRAAPDTIVADSVPASDRPSADNGGTAAEEVGTAAVAGSRGPASPAEPAGAERSAERTTAATDSAAGILARAAERYREVRSLQAEFRMQLDNPLLRSSIASAGTLYQKRPDRLLLRFSDPTGDVIVSDGEYFWIYYPSANAEQVVRSAASERGRSGVDLQAQFLGDPTVRFDYTLEATESVNGRSAWRMLLVPKQRAGYRSLRVWLDQRDHLARRFEITEDNGSVRRFELRNLRVDPALSDTLFRFQPPAGVRVIAP
jgi:outer membrane lipoprotein-sorting protein